MSGEIFIGGAGAGHGDAVGLLLATANRHGLIAGATGTGKTITLQILAEGFSRAGTSVFLADVKGDLSGLADAGSGAHKLHEKLQARAATIGLEDYAYAAAPVEFWDVFGEQGAPMRARVSDLGPVILSRLLDLNEVQEGVLNVVFRVAADEALPLIDLKDLRAMLADVAERARDLGAMYGGVSRASVAAIQRRLLVLENQGATHFFGEPALALDDLLRADAGGRGVVNILAADKLLRAPRLYAVFLFWLLSKLFDELPEVGDPEKPKIAFFFDEAHLLFDDAPKALVDQVEQVARLIRSKGVGVFFVTQSPSDVPDTVLGQLGARVQHALRAYTPRERKALRAAAATFRPNPAFETEEVLPQLGVGEALVSTLNEKGAPSVVRRTLVRPPSSRIGPISDARRRAVRDGSDLERRYAEAVDRHSAYEALAERRERAADAAAAELERVEREAEQARREAAARRETSRRRGAASRRSGGRERSTARRAERSFWGSLADRLGRALAGVVIDSVTGRRRRR